ncbi:MAG: radical SAM family heme chaperone HemW [bacterium]|nr:radical SAM family heme chaperone HemW [bacterium]
MSDLIDRAAAERAAYVHIPFCHRRCRYCDFAVVELSADPSPINRYVAAVVAEIGMADDWEPLHAVNLGGGTPSVLAPSQIGEIMTALDRRFGLAGDAEVSIEANPEGFTTAYAEALCAVGVNRVSLGVQSFDADVLNYLGRVHTPDEAVAAVDNAKAVGMRTVNVDLMFGTAGELPASWTQTLRTAIELNPQHLSAYALTVEFGTALSRDVASGSPGPDSDDQADKYEAIVETVTGLSHYEVSNWAQHGHECRYNLTTWAQGDYDAFGLGAHGHRNGERSRNFRRIDAYLNRVESGERPVQGRERLSRWDREKERLFLGLRLREGARVGEAGEALLTSAAGLRFVAAGVIARDGDRLTVLRPLLTDAVARGVLTLVEPATT